MTTINTTTANTTNNVFVMLFPHSEYNGFDVFGGVFLAKEDAIAEYNKHNFNDRYPIAETLVKEDEEYGVTFILPIHDKERIEEIKAEFENDAHDAAYYYGGYIIRKINMKR